MERQLTMPSIVYIINIRLPAIYGGMNMRMKTSVNFIKGFSRALDLTGAKEWPNLANDRTADYEALRKDWENVGKAIEKAAESYEKCGID